MDLSISPDRVAGDYIRVLPVPLSAIEKLDDILWEANPKKHDIGGIYESIERYGFVDPPHWDNNLNGGKGGIVFGNGRTKTIVSTLIEARRLGKEPPRGIPVDKETGDWCIPIAFGVDQSSEAEAIALGIDHNNLTMSGGDFTAIDMAKMWDMEGYIELLSSIADEDITPITVDEEAIGSLLLAIAGSEEESPADTEEDLDKIIEDAESDDYEVRVKAGEIWKLGRHYIACGDCTDRDSIAKLIELASVSKVDMVWADPPYGVSIVSTNNFVGGGDCRPTTIAECAAKRLGTVGGSKPFGSADIRGTDSASNIVKANKYYPIAGDDSIDTAIESTDAYLDLFSDAVHCWWGGNYFAHVLPPSNCWIVWDKENTGDFADAELAWTNQATAVRIFKHMWNGMVKASEHGQRRVHPTQKPIKLLTWFAEKYGKSGDVIIDPFLGSGISVIGCEELGDRTLIGFELSPHYCSIILDRWEKQTGEIAELVGRLDGSAIAIDKNR